MRNSNLIPVRERFACSDDCHRDRVRIYNSSGMVIAVDAHRLFRASIYQDRGSRC